MIQRKKTASPARNIAKSRTTITKLSQGVIFCQSPTRKIKEYVGRSDAPCLQVRKAREDTQNFLNATIICDPDVLVVRVLVRRVGTPRQLIHPVHRPRQQNAEFLVQGPGTIGPLEHPRAWLVHSWRNHDALSQRKMRCDAVKPVLAGYRTPSVNREDSQLWAWLNQEFDAVVGHGASLILRANQDQLDKSWASYSDNLKDWDKLKH